MGWGGGGGGGGGESFRASLQIHTCFNHLHRLAMSSTDMHAFSDINQTALRLTLTNINMDTVYGLGISYMHN